MLFSAGILQRSCISALWHSGTHFFPLLGCRSEEMLLEQQEAEHIELRPNLLKACADERQSFCRNVQPGAGRVFR